MSVLTMERTFPTPPEKVFAFITEPHNLLMWWGPEGTRITDHNLDFSKTGEWSATMVGPQGHAAHVGGTVTGIDPPNWVELTLSFRDAAGNGGEQSIIRFETHSNGAGGTNFILRQSGLKAEHIPDMRDKGWASALQRLQDLILNN